jgi:hypothetical protein
MIIADNRRRWAVLALVLGVALFALLVLPPIIGGGPAAAPPVATAPPSAEPTREPECPVRTDPYYYALQGMKQSPNAFGPPVILWNGAASARSEFLFRVCGSRKLVIGGDWALFSTIKAEVDGTDRNERFSSVDSWAATLNQFLRRIDWSMSRVYRARPVAVSTYYMLKGDDRRPVVHPDSYKEEPESTYMTLPVRSRGQLVVVTLRLDCGFQPVKFLGPVTELLF